MSKAVFAHTHVCSVRFDYLSYGYLHTSVPCASSAPTAYYSKHLPRAMPAPLLVTGWISYRTATAG
jgi:hypothetical protein